jgi:hypothetical protein
VAATTAGPSDPGCDASAMPTARSATSPGSPDQRSGTPEDLPPLELRTLRELRLEAPSAEDRPAFVSAASGVVRRGDFVYVIGDDELFLAVFAASAAERPGTLRRALAGELPLDHDARAGAKPDLEALTVLPPFGGHPYGALLGLGSGSGPGRDRGFVWALAPDGALRGQAGEVDLSALYEGLGAEIEALNIEGASVIGDRLWLLQRGGGERGAAGIVAELALEDVMGSLRRDRRIDAHELRALRAYDLGTLDGVPLTFSDATPVAQELLVFTASAEAEDGRIRGSVVGTLDREGHVQRLRTIDRRYKVEGVHATIDTGVMDFLFVCDQDDPEVPSPLLSAAMPVDGALEREG